jgi:hypothetical protein
MERPAYMAAVMPAGPAPTMMTSYSNSLAKGEKSREWGDGR